MIGKPDKILDKEQVADIILYNRPVKPSRKQLVDKDRLADLHDNMRLLHNYEESGDHKPGKRVLSFKQRPMTAPTKSAFFQISRGNYQFENHRNHGSMLDLHKMYEPPIPKHLIPTNNPFYNKSMSSHGA